MKNKLFPLLVLLIIFTSCDKKKSVLKDLTGDWTVYSYTFQNESGLSYEYTTTGSFHFENCGEEYCSYNYSMTSVVSGINQVKEESGEYKLENDGEHFEFKRNNNDGSISTFPENRILLINKDQMKMLFHDETGTHHLILEK